MRSDATTSTRTAAPANPLFDASFYRERYALELDDTDLYRHFCGEGRFQGLDPNEYFSTSWYLAQNADVRKSKVDPLDHYLERGASEGRDPGPAFGSWLYWLLHADVRRSGMNPLLHYLRHGRQEGRIVPTIETTSWSAADAPVAPPRTTVRSACSSPHAERLAATVGVPGGGAPPIDARAPVRQRAPAVRPRPPKADPAAELVMARRCPTRVRWFARLFARDLAASFHGVRLLGALPDPTDGPLVLLTNHASWWDAELYHWLATTAFPQRRGFAPMEANNLARYPSLTRLGAFPTAPGGGFRGASAFLATAERLLHETDAVLFVAAEGRFRDVRARPVGVLPGLAHLALRVPAATFVPLAIDYVFWKDRRPNLLLRFGQSMTGAAFEGAGTGEIAARMSRALEAAMSALADAGMSRQPLRFTTLLEEAAPRPSADLWRRFGMLAGGAAPRTRLPRVADPGGPMAGGHVPTASDVAPAGQ